VKHTLPICLERFIFNFREHCRKFREECGRESIKFMNFDSTARRTHDSFLIWSQQHDHRVLESHRVMKLPAVKALLDAARTRLAWFIDFHDWSVSLVVANQYPSTVSRVASIGLSLSLSPSLTSIREQIFSAPVNNLLSNVAEYCMNASARTVRRNRIKSKPTRVFPTRFSTNLREKVRNVHSYLTFSFFLSLRKAEFLPDGSVRY